VSRVARKYLNETQSVTGVLLPEKKATQRTQKAGDEARKS
jgi:hypothetical protein